MGNEDKWKANQQKVAHLRQFPGLLTSWEHTAGSTIEQVVPIPDSANNYVLLLSQGKFAVVPPIHQEPQILTAGLLSARPHLEPHHQEAFKEYDRLTYVDQEAGRQARLGNILNAIDNNLERIPELKTHIRDLVHRWDHEENSSS